jgi:RimJ/RimL family protein N-acetyltransferase
MRGGTAGAGRAYGRGFYPERMCTLSTARLELRPWADGFEDDLFRLSSDERMMRFIGDGRPWTRERTAERHRACLRHWEQHGFGWRGIFDRDDFVGVAALNRLGTTVPGIEEDATEIGWWVAPESWGRGLATEAALALRDEAFAGLGAQRLAARYQPSNEASGRIMIKIGMRVFGDTVGASGEPVRVCELRRADWEALRP